jgi:hypothetical protein
LIDRIRKQCMQFFPAHGKGDVILVRAWGARNRRMASAHVGRVPPLVTKLLSVFHQKYQTLSSYKGTGKMAASAVTYTRSPAAGRTA